MGNATYDNTTNNPHNPSNPPITVSAGENTKDEMMVAFIAYTTYQAGDENIILDSTLVTSGVEENRKSKIVIYPNPANDKLNISSDEEIKLIRLYQSDGKNISVNKEINEIDISGLEIGLYFIEVQTSTKRFFEKIVINR
jgi:hypothetical protein